MVLSDEELTQIYSDAIRGYAEKNPDEWGFPTHVPMRAAYRAAMQDVAARLREKADKLLEIQAHYEIQAVIEERALELNKAADEIEAMAKEE